ncbi:MAG: rRNA maturation RNase YbeY [Erysipelotrichaceae bacterium]|nr:rRNA maturation RNase YbeY [Erysipelotrichaceae bacterium]MBQ1811262.1 rRNA maturation RNase YbeY [Erysipelotrichaceae bacterium]MBQ2584606.1 rRNA maturation RNase YbeY [Erysipelotrichaceae bacterium]MBQ2656228.1 rRNA maturation RNase YbeY [Erysipelotrichaceae bacterium]MBQ3962842.1 rRNA maturation RNase YbeY [Erysipelotrichaceae bacterium]
MLNIVNKSRYNDLKDYYPYLEEYYQKTLEVLQIEDNYVLSLIICGPITIKRINRDYRNKDAVTDVISFALLDNEDAVEYEDCIELGDIFINRQRVFSQAKEYGHSVKREFVFLFVHGLLHLLGYDHMNKEDEEKMFSLQRQIVGDLK